MTARVALSIGCPCGVGPEVSVVAAAKAGGRVLLVGDHRVVQRAARVRKLDPERFVLVFDPSPPNKLGKGKIGVFQPTRPLGARDMRYGVPSRASGAAQLAWVDAACDLAARGAAVAIVTGPVNKDVIAGSGARGAARFLGHTEHLQSRLGSREAVMAFWSESLMTSLATTHVPIAGVPRAVTPQAVERATYWLARLLAQLGHTRAKIAVCGLNPHAGEGGRLGREEAKSIAPGITRAKKRLKREHARVTIVGPMGGESAFRLAVVGRYDGVVAMYHDQATIPTKLLGFGDTVNVTLGLPIVRTSVDHGTGYDIAGKGVADAGGMAEAIALALRLAAHPLPRQ
jgi:4-hydroxythreonine-4-phosphate dehydrogenase